MNPQEGDPEKVDYNYRAIQPVNGGDGEGKGHFGRVVRFSYFAATCFGR